MSTREEHAEQIKDLEERKSRLEQQIREIRNKIRRIQDVVAGKIL